MSESVQYLRSTCYRCGVATVPQYDPEVETRLCHGCRGVRPSAPAPNYPEWAGRLGAHLGAMLGDPSDAVRELAARDHVEWQRVTGHADRMTSPLGDHRERSVPCIDCRRPTWTIEPRCDACHERMADVRATGDGSAA